MQDQADYSKYFCLLTENVFKAETNKQKWKIAPCLQKPLLLTWFNFNPSMDKLLRAMKSVGWNYLSIPKLQRLHRWSLGMDK